MRVLGGGGPGGGGESVKRGGAGGGGGRGGREEGRREEEEREEGGGLTLTPVDDIVWLLGWGKEGRMDGDELGGQLRGIGEVGGGEGPWAMGDVVVVVGGVGG